MSISFGCVYLVERSFGLISSSPVHMTRYICDFRLSIASSSLLANCEKFSTVFSSRVVRLCFRSVFLSQFVSFSRDFEVSSSSGILVEPHFRWFLMEQIWQGGKRGGCRGSRWRVYCDRGYGRRVGSV